MQSSSRVLHTRSGDIPLPAYVPVTTFGRKYPLDDLVRPYLPRLASAVMVSFHYAKQMEDKPRLPLMVDSGGFASLFDGAEVYEHNGLGMLRVAQEEEPEVNPKEVLDFQERIADVAFTLDFPIPPGMESSEAKRRQHLTIVNAIWALHNRRRRDLLLYGCVQAWDAASAKRCARELAKYEFDGFAIGGLVPRVRKPELVLAIVRAVRAEIGDRPLHVFGLGQPDLLKDLFDSGTDSVDSSSYVKMAADGRLWGQPDARFSDPSPMDRLHIALCNLAYATGRTLPLSTSSLVFSTLAMERTRIR